MTTITIGISLLLATRAAVAQSVSGTLISPPNTPPPSGVIVMLVDTLGHTVAQRLSSASGAFQLQAPGAGTFTVRALRIGFRPSTSERFSLGAGEVLKLEVALNSAAVELARTSVSTSRQCDAPKDSTTAAFVVWTEARKALLSAALARQEPYVMEIAKFERVHEVPGNLLKSESEVVQRDNTARPFVSIPLEQLDARGYVVMDSSGTTYSAPDENVLLSEQFASTHCLRLESPTASEMTLAFEPVRDRRLPDVKGILVVNRNTGALEHLEFSFVNVPGVITAAHAGGKIHFRQLSSGGFIIDDWQLDMPVIVQQTNLTATSMNNLERGALQRGSVFSTRAMQQTGGTVTVVQRGKDVIYEAPLPSLTGQVVDNSGVAVPNAQVTIATTLRTGESDARGQFRIRAVRPGKRNLVVSYPLLDTLMMPRFEREVDSRNGAPVLITVPERMRLIQNVCAATRDPARGILKATVRDSLGTPMGNSPVHAEWFEPKGFKWDEKRPGFENSINTSTDANGDILLCDVPVDQGVYVSYMRDGLKYEGKGRIAPGDQVAWSQIRLLKQGEQKPK